MRWRSKRPDCAARPRPAWPVAKVWRNKRAPLSGEPIPARRPARGRPQQQIAPESAKPSAEHARAQTYDGSRYADVPVVGSRPAASATLLQRGSCAHSPASATRTSLAACRIDDPRGLGSPLRRRASLSGPAATGSRQSRIPEAARRLLNGRAHPAPGLPAETSRMPDERRSRRARHAAPPASVRNARRVEQGAQGTSCSAVTSRAWHGQDCTRELATERTRRRSADASRFRRMQPATRTLCSQRVNIGHAVDQRCQATRPQLLH